MLATSVGVATIAFARGSWARRIAGAFLVFLPHLIGAPVAAGESPIPRELAETFAIASVATQAVFWIALGAIGGWLFARLGRQPALAGTRS